jgi:putative phosphoribosyl transferase
MKLNYSVKKNHPSSYDYSINPPFPDRETAGQLLAQTLEPYRDRTDTIVLALSPDGFPVAKQITLQLRLPLDLLPVRNIGVPGREELVMGAVAIDDTLIWNEAVMRRSGANRNEIEDAVRKERDVLQQWERIYRGMRPFPQLKGRRVILVDDGLTSGSRMRAAIVAVCLQKVERIIIALPVAPPDIVAGLRKCTDEVICLVTPEPFHNVHEWYLDFIPPTDASIRRTLDAAWEQSPHSKNWIPRDKKKRDQKIPE